MARGQSLSPACRLGEHDRCHDGAAIVCACPCHRGLIVPEPAPDEGGAASRR